MIKITTLIDNMATEHQSLIHMHSLSYHVEADGVPILFDFGSGPEFLDNAKKLGISPLDASYCVCSHSHYDHAAGYIELLDRGISCPLITGEHFFEEKYTNHRTEKYTYLGCSFTEADLSAHRIPHFVCRDILEFSPGCYAVGNFPRTYEFETVPARFVKRTEDGMIPDPFDDEICFVLDHRDGLIVILGCSHPGVLNILSAVSKRFGKRIQAVIGGTHLMKADDKRIERTLAELKNMDIRLLALNHCSGDKVREYLENDSDINGFHMGCGDCLFF